MSDYQPKKSPSQWISIQEAARRAPYSQEYLSLLARRGKIFAKKIGRNWYTTHEALERYVVELASAPSSLNLMEEFKRLNPQVFGPQNTKQESGSRNQEVGTKKQETELVPTAPIIVPGPIIPEVSSKPSNTTSSGSASRRQDDVDILGKPSNTTPTNFSSDEKSGQRQVGEDILGKLDRLSDSLETFASSVTQAIPAITQANQSAPLNPEVEEFIQERINSSAHRYYHFNRFSKSMVRSPTRLVTIMVTAIVLLFVLVGGFSFGQVDAVVQSIKKAFTDATTIQGHFAGTHANEVLIIDKAGNISIYGHIETEGQLRSRAPDGVAPIVVDSTTKVENLNADYIDNISSQDFTLAFITKNGNLTYEDVHLMGDVEVGELLKVGGDALIGKTLTVSGAMKLMDSLTVYGKLGVLSDAVFGKDVTLTNGNLIIGKGTIKITSMTLVKNLNAEYLDGAKKGDINLQFVTSNGNTTTSPITVGGLTSTGTITSYGPGFFNSSIWSPFGSFGDLGVGKSASFGDSKNPSNSKFEVYSKYFSVNNIGNVSISGSLTAEHTSIGNLLVRGSVLSNLIPSGSFDLGSSTNLWDELYVSSASFTTLTITGTAGGNFSGTTSSSFVINTDNTTADTEDSYLSFERGTTTPNAIFKWDSINKQFNFNQPVKISSVSFEVIGIASISGDLILNGSGAASGRLQLSRAPTIPHTGTWPSFSGLDDATLLINPSTSTADGNLIAVTVGGAAKFVVDNEGDVYVAGNLILSGTTTQSTTSITGDLNVEGNTRLGDAISDKIRFVGTILPYTLTSNIVSIQASPSWAGDYYIRTLDSSSNPIFFVASTSVGYFSGNVGIGTTGPTTTLDVIGSASVSQNFEVGGTASISGNLTLGSLTALSAVYTDASKNLTSDTPTTGQLGYWTRSGTDLYNTNQGDNVGIGTTVPVAKLQVNSTTIGQGIISVSSPATGFNQVMSKYQFYNSYSPWDAGWGTQTLAEITTLTGVDSHAVGNLSFSVKKTTADAAVTEIMRITNSGNVGIGTTGPTTTLDVIGSASVSQNFEVGGTASISGNLTLGSLTALSAVYTDASKNLTSDTPTTGQLGYWTRSGTDLYNTNQGDNVGIGTTTPQRKLDISNTGQITFGDDVTTDGSQGLYWHSGTGYGIYRTAGAWTASTYQQLKISFATGIILDPGSGTYDKSHVGVIGGMSIGDTYYSTKYDNGLIVQGNVGIGTSAPSSLLYLYSTTTHQDKITFQDASNLTQTRGGEIYGSYGGNGLVIDTLQGDDATWIRYGSANGYVDYHQWYSNGVEVMRIHNNGNVGIGTTVPGGTLNPEGPYGLPPTTGTATTLNILRLSNTTGHQTGGVLDFGQNGTLGGWIQSRSGGDYSVNYPLLLNPNGGNVGIGTTEPLEKLTVYGTSINLGLQAAASSQTLGIKWINSADATISSITSNTGVGDFTFNAFNAAAAMTIKATTGNVGIGTTSPSYNLHIVNSAASYGEIYLKNANSAYGAASEIVNDLTASLAMSTYGSTNAAANIFGLARANRSFIFSQGADSLGLTVGTFNATNLTLGTNNAANVTIQSGGNVGIGTTTPGYKLTVNTTTANDQAVRGVNAATTGTNYGGVFVANGVGPTENIGGYFFVAGATTNKAVHIDTLVAGANNYALYSSALAKSYFAGNVGIGTTGPTNRLDVRNSATAGSLNTAPILKIANTVGASNWTSIHLTDGVTSDGFIGFFSGTSNATSRLGFAAGGATEILSIKGDGNVGIGTTGPTAKLHIVSAGEAVKVVGVTTGATYSSWNNTNVSLYVGNNDVAGTALPFTGALASGVFVGTDANFPLQLFTNNVARLTILNGGNVGIGTTAPGYKLEVAGGATDDVLKVTSTRNIANPAMFYLQHNRGIANAANADINQLVFAQDSNAVASAITSSIQQVTQDVTSTAGGALAFSTGGIGAAKERVRITNTGNVGIGTTVPGAKLDIVDSASTGAAIRLREGTTNGTGYIGLKAPDAITTSVTFTLPNADGSSGQVLQTNGTGTLSWSAQTTSGMSNPMTTTGDIIYGSNTAAPSTPARLGIGGAGQCLVVTAGLPAWGACTGTSTAAGADTQIQYNNGGSLGASSDFIWNNTNKTLSVTGTNTGAKVSLALLNSSTGSGASNEFRIGNNAGADALTLSVNSSNFTSSASYAYIYNRLNAPLILGTNNTPRMTISATGNVGIGTTAPVSRLNVSGGDLQVETGMGRFKGWYNAGSGLALETGISGGEGYIYAYNRTTSTQAKLNLGPSGITIDTTGKVGIGTTVPGSKLEVAGTLTVSGANLTSLGGNLTVTGTAWTATPTISGLITATSGLTANGTLDANSVVTLGDNADNITIDSNVWDITAAGAISGVTTISSGAITSSGALNLGTNTITSGLINGQTISSAANFTGSVAIATTLDANGVVNLGDNGDNITIDSNVWDITAAGAISGVTTISSGAITSSGALNLGANTITSGLINGQTISAAANFTGSLNAVSWADTTLVTNLNADLLDGQSSAYYMPASTDNWVNTTGDTMTGALTNTLATGNSLIWDTNTLIVDATNNRVGIGTTGPTNRLDVRNSATAGSLNTAPILKIANTVGASNWTSIHLTDGVTSDGFIGFFSGTSNATSRLGFAAGGATEILSIKGDGNVGIGTTAPGAKLHIDTVSGNAAGLNLLASSMTDNQYIYQAIGKSTADNNGFLLIYTQHATDSTRRLTIGTNEGWSTGEGLTVLGNGNVGIGTTVPLSLLHVGSSATAFGNSNVVRIANNNIETLALAGSSGNTNLNFYQNGTTARKATIQSIPSGTSSLGGTLSFWTKPATAGDVVQRMSISDTGAILMANYPTGTCCADIAEFYPSSEPVEAADVVAVDPNNPTTLRKARGANDTLVGIVSTNPAIAIEEQHLLVAGGAESYVQNPLKPVIALAGRVPVKVTDENGSVKAGDRLTVSNAVPGFAMKMTSAGQSIGVALADFSTIASGSENKVMTFVNLSYWAPSADQLTTNNPPPTTASGSSSVVVTSTGSPVDVLATLANTVMTRVQSIWASGDVISQGIKKTYYALTELPIFNLQFSIADWGTRSITIANTASDTTKALLTGPTAQAADQSKVDLAENGNYLATYGVDSTRGEIQLSGTSQIVNGEARVFFDYSFSSIISDTTPVKVIVTPTSIMQGQLYTDSKSQYGFVVKELNSQDTGTFDWLVIARRRGFEDPNTNQESGITNQGNPTPTPDVSPSPDTTPSPTPTPDLSTESSGGQASPTSTPIPDVTPSPTPDPTPSPTPDITPTPSPDATPTP